MRLYIANVSRQTHVVCYRLDYDKTGALLDTNRRFQPARQQDIPPGRQVQIGGDLHEAQLNQIVEQLEPYGLIHADDVGRHRNVPTPYIYSRDRPVPAEAMRKVQGANSEILIEQGKERRAKAAVASNEIVQQAVSHQFAQVGIEEPPADRTTVTFEQLEQSDQGEKRVEEGYKVVPEKTATGRKPTKRK